MSNLIIHYKHIMNIDDNTVYNYPITLIINTNNTTKIISIISPYI